MHILLKSATHNHASASTAINYINIFAGGLQEIHYCHDKLLETKQICLIYVAAKEMGLEEIPINPDLKVRAALLD